MKAALAQKSVFVIALLLIFSSSFANYYRTNSKNKLSTCLKSPSSVIFSNHYPVNLLVTLRLGDYSQFIARHSHKTVNTFQFALTDGFKQPGCIAYFNFFSGTNHRRFTSSCKTLLFPFHVFWWLQGFQLCL